MGKDSFNSSQSKALKKRVVVPPKPIPGLLPGDDRITRRNKILTAALREVEPQASKTRVKDVLAQWDNLSRKEVIGMPPHLPLHVLGWSKTNEKSGTFVPVVATYDGDEDEENLVYIQVIAEMSSLFNYGIMQWKIRNDVRMAAGNVGKGKQQPITWEDILQYPALVFQIVRDGKKYHVPIISSSAIRKRLSDSQSARERPAQAPPESSQLKEYKHEAEHQLGVARIFAKHPHASDLAVTVTGCNFSDSAGCQRFEDWMVAGKRVRKGHTFSFPPEAEPEEEEEAQEDVEMESEEPKKKKKDKKKRKREEKEEKKDKKKKSKKGEEKEKEDQLRKKQEEEQKKIEEEKKKKEAEKKKEAQKKKEEEEKEKKKEQANKEETRKKKDKKKKKEDPEPSHEKTSAHGVTLCLNTVSPFAKAVAEKLENTSNVQKIQKHTSSRVLLFMKEVADARIQTFGAMVDLMKKHFKDAAMAIALINHLFPMAEPLSCGGFSFDFKSPINPSGKPVYHSGIEKVMSLCWGSRESALITAQLIDQAGLNDFNEDGDDIGEVLTLSSQNMALCLFMSYHDSSMKVTDFEWN